MTPEEMQQRAKLLYWKIANLTHPRYCAAAKGPDDMPYETEADCDCGLREVKEFLFLLAESAV